MAELIELKTFYDDRGCLTVIEKDIPFPIKRIFYIYNVDNSTRGQHRHKTTRQAIICLKGKCSIHNHTIDDKRNEYVLDNPHKCLIVEPEDWHYMDHFTSDCILQVFASTYFDPDDYIYEDYKR